MRRPRSHRQPLPHRTAPGGAAELIYTVTVNSTGLALVYLARNDAVFAGHAGAEGAFRRVTAADLWPVEGIRHDVVACVAASPRHRELIAPLLATGVDWQLPGPNTAPNAGLTVLTLGGAPAAIGLVVARLWCYPTRKRCTTPRRCSPWRRSTLRASTSGAIRSATPS